MDLLKRYTAITISVLIVSVTLLYNYIAYIGFEISDLYVYLRYADNVVNGNGLVFNAGEYVESYSSIIWLFLISLLRLMSNQPEMLLHVINAVALLSIIAVVYKTCMKLDVKNTILLQFLSIMLVATSISLLYWTTKGTGTVFLSFLMIITFYIVHFMRNSWFYRHVWVLYSLMILSGVEGTVLVFLFILMETKNCTFSKSYKLYRKENKTTSYLIYNVLMALIVIISYIIFKLSYYDTIISMNNLSSYHYSNTITGIENILSYLEAYLPSLLLLFVPFIKKKPPFIFDASLLTLGYLAYLVITSYSIDLEYKALVPVIPLIIIQITFVAVRIYKYPGNKKSQKGIAMFVILLIALLNCKVIVKDGQLLSVIREDEIVRAGKQVGKWLKEHFPHETRIASFNVPATAYESEMYIKNLVKSYNKSQSYQEAIDEALRDNCDIILEDAVFADKKSKQAYIIPDKFDSKYIRKTAKIENPVKRTTENRLARENKTYDYSDIGLYIYQFPDSLFGGGIKYNFDFTLSYMFNMESELPMINDSFAQSFDLSQLSTVIIQPERHKDGKLQRLNETGVAFAKNQNYEKAENVFRRLIKKDSDFINGYFNLGRTYIYMNLYRKAIEQFKIVIRKNPFFSEAYLMIGNIYNKYLNDRASAIIYYKKYVDTVYDNAKRKEIIKNFLSK